MNEEEIRKQQLEIMKRAAVLRYLTKEARERLNRVRAVYPDLAEKVELALLQSLQYGEIGEINDEQLKRILSELSSNKKKFRILK